MAKPEEKKEVPAWVVTFADLMSLLLTFFILLLSFAELNATKFRKVAGSLKMAFGVQRVSIFDEPPAGSSFIMQEHRAGGASVPMGSNAGLNMLDPQLQAIKNKQEKDGRVAIIEKEKKLKRNIKKIFAKLSAEIKEGKIEITHKDQDLIIRVNEDAIYPKGGARMQKSFDGLLDKVADILHDVEGNIHIGGHSDDRKFKSTKYKSNWALSAARAMNLGQALMKTGDIPEERITIEVHGPTKPVVRNNSKVNRKRNRRTEIVIKH